MKQITKKTIITIDGVEHVVSTSDFSQSVNDFANDFDREIGGSINDQDIIDYVLSWD